MSRLVLVKVYCAVLFGLALGAAVGASASTVTTGKAKRHSAGTTRVATKATAHVSSHTGVRTAAKATSGTHAVTTRTVTTRTRAHGHGARPMLAVRRTRYREHFSASSPARCSKARLIFIWVNGIARPGLSVYVIPNGICSIGKLLLDAQDYRVVACFVKSASAPIDDWSGS